MPGFYPQGPPPYTPYSSGPSRPGTWKPPAPNFQYHLPSENTPLIGETRRVRLGHPPTRNRRVAQARTKKIELGSTTNHTPLILLLSLLLVFITAFSVVTTLAVDYKAKLDDALIPENIRLRHEVWAKEKQVHEHVKASWAKEELRLRDEYKRSEIEWAKKTEALRKEHERVKASWAKEELRLSDDYKRSEIEWDNKKEGLRKEHDRLKDIWTRENERYHRDQIQWERERKAEEKRIRENERRRLGITWEPPFAHKCAAYGTRPYSAKLMNVPSGFDSIEACGEMPIVFHDRTIEKPSRCEKAWNGDVYGHWVINFDEPLCQPYWANPEDKGCVGYKSGLRRWEARLLDIDKGDSWSLMCGTTSNTINGHHFTTPTHCEDRGIWSGMVGIFDAPDSGCI